MKSKSCFVRITDPTVSTSAHSNAGKEEAVDCRGGSDSNTSVRSRARTLINLSINDHFSYLKSFPNLSFLDSR